MSQVANKKENMKKSRASRPNADYPIQVRVHKRYHKLSTPLDFLLPPIIFAVAIFNYVYPIANSC